MNNNFNKVYNISISTFTVVKILLVLLMLYFLYIVRDILVVLFIALILSSAIKPFVDWMQRKKIPRALSMILIYFTLAIVISLIIYLIIPPMVEQIGEITKNLPRYLDLLSTRFSNIKDYTGQVYSLAGALDALKTSLQTNATSVLSALSGIFGSIVSFFLVLVVTFYMVVEENAMKKIVWSIVPLKNQPYVMRLIVRMQKKIGNWLIGQLILCFTVGLFIFLGLVILRVKYALILALLAGLFEAIPYLGPLLSAIPAVFLAFSQAPTLAIFVAIFYYAVQFTENNVLVPKIMQKAVGLNPVISITALLIGFKLAGIAGALLAIPVATAASVFIQDVFDNKVGEMETFEEAD
jgi:predicted PurR-regulated permease PerM